MRSFSRARLLVAMLAIVVGASACSRLAPPVPSTEVQGTDDSPEGAGRSADGSDEPRVDFETYEAAVNNLVACMQESGAPITEPAFDAATGLFEYDYDEASESVFQECSQTHFADIDLAAYEANPDQPAIADDGPIGDWSGLDPSSWVRLMSRIELTSNTRWSPVTILDLARASDRFDVRRPQAGDSDKAVFDYLGELAAEAGIVPAGPLAAFGRSAFPDQMRTELGFDQRAFDQMIEAGVDARTIVAATGSFDPEAVATATEEDLIWGPIREVSTFGDVATYSWGIDFDLDLDRFSPTRPVGHNRRLGVTPDSALWTRWTEGLTGSIAASRGEVRSLADVDALRALALIGDEHELFAAVLASSLAAFMGDLADLRTAESLIARPAALMIGDGADRAGRYTLLALAYDDPLTAEAELPLFEARMAEVSELARVDEADQVMEEPRTFDVEHVGSTLIARIWLTDDVMVPAAELVRFR